MEEGVDEGDKPPTRGAWLLVALDDLFLDVAFHHEINPGGGFGLNGHV